MLCSHHSLSFQSHSASLKLRFLLGSNLRWKLGPNLIIWLRSVSNSNLRSNFGTRLNSCLRSMLSPNLVASLRSIRISNSCSIAQSQWFRDENRIKRDSKISVDRGRRTGENVIRFAKHQRFPSIVGLARLRHTTIHSRVNIDIGNHYRRPGVKS